MMALAVSVAPGKQKKQNRAAPPHARRHHGGEGHLKARRARRPRSCTSRASPSTPSTTPRRSRHYREVQEDRRSGDVGRCDGSVGRSQGPCRGGPAAHHGRARAHRPAGPRAERTARAVPTPAAESAFGFQLHIGLLCPFPQKNHDLCTRAKALTQAAAVQPLPKRRARCRTMIIT